MTTVSLNKKTNSTKFGNDYVIPSTKRLHNAYTNISKRFREWRLKYSLINETCKLQAVTNDAQRFWGKFKGAEKDRKFKTVAYPVNETVLSWAKRYEYRSIICWQFWRVSPVVGQPFIFWWQICVTKSGSKLVTGLILEILEFENDKSKRISPNTNSLVIHVLYQITFRGTINVFEIQIKSAILLKYFQLSLQLSISRNIFRDFRDFAGYCSLKMASNRCVDLLPQGTFWKADS